MNRPPTFHVDCQVQNLADRKRNTLLHNLRVNSDVMTTWLPKDCLKPLGIEPARQINFQRENGLRIRRDTGFVVLRVDNHFTCEEVAFAENGDPQLLGWRALNGMNVQYDPRRRTLVERGPVPVACAAE